MRRSALVFLVAATVVSAGGFSWAKPRHDRTDPRVRFTTARDAVVVGAPADHEATAVRGTATDDLSGIRTVEAFFVRCTQYQGYEGGGFSRSSIVLGGEPSDLAPLREGTPTVSCRSRRSCSWSVRVPLVPGEYLVAVSVTDRAGNEGGNVTHITVV